jgi:hypothetical protein
MPTLGKGAAAHPNDNCGSDEHSGLLKLSSDLEFDVASVEPSVDGVQVLEWH